MLPRMKTLVRWLLLAGARRLAVAGCTRLKISFLSGNDAAKKAYVGAGFRPTTAIRTWEQRPAAP